MVEPLGGPRVPAEQCTAMSKQSGERCRNRVQGGGVCRFHGGASPRARAAREARILEKRRTMLYPASEQRTPAEALRAAGESLDAALQGLEQLARDGGMLTVELVREIRSQAESSARTQKLILDAKIEQRRSALAERLATEVEVLLKGVFEDLEFTPEQMRRVNPIVARRLRALAKVELPEY